MPRQSNSSTDRSEASNDGEHWATLILILTLAQFPVFQALFGGQAMREVLYTSTVIASGPLFRSAPLSLAYPWPTLATLSTIDAIVL